MNVDQAPLQGIDVVHDLDVVPWPFREDEFDEVVAAHVFEHVERPLEFMAEVWRVLAWGGIALIHGPHWQSVDAFTDPTHRRALTEFTFDYWVPGTGLHERYGEAYARGRCFEKLAVGVADGEVVARLRKI